MSPTRSPESQQLRLFDDDGGFDLAQLREEQAVMAAQKKYAANTIRGYDSGWRAFAAWCEKAGRSALPASSDTCQLYLIHMAKSGRLPATMEHRMSAVVSKHVISGLRSPLDEGVREILNGLTRKLGAKSKHAKTPISIEDLKAMLKATPDDAKGTRDKALLLVGFASSMRRSELVTIQLEDVLFEPKGMVILLGRSKTDQKGIGRPVGIHKGKHRLTDPVGILKAWIRERGSWPGPLFLANRANTDAFKRTAMCAQSVAQVVKDAATRAGLDPKRYGAHSMRAGLVTAAGCNNVGTLAIMERTGHRDEKTVLRYMRPALALMVDPLAGLL